MSSNDSSEVACLPAGGRRHRWQEFLSPFYEQQGAAAVANEKDEFAVRDAAQKTFNESSANKPVEPVIAMRRLESDCAITSIVLSRLYHLVDKSDTTFAWSTGQPEYESSTRRSIYSARVGSELSHSMTLPTRSVSVNRQFSTGLSLEVDSSMRCSTTPLTNCWWWLRPQFGHEG